MRAVDQRWTKTATVLAGRSTAADAVTFRSVNARLRERDGRIASTGTPRQNFSGRNTSMSLTNKTIA